MQGSHVACFVPARRVPRAERLVLETRSMIWPDKAAVGIFQGIFLPTHFENLLCSITLRHQVSLPALSTRGNDT